MRHLNFPLSFFLFAALSIAADNNEPPKLRLPAGVRPTHYSVDVTVTPGKDDFSGIVDIDVEIAQPQSVVWLNATEIKFQQAEWKISGRTLPATIIPGNKEFVGLSFPEPVSGHGVLHAVYQGKITRNSSAGVFQMQDGKEWYVYTQFEPTDARRAFPCFDEPSFKVPWQLTLHVPKDDSAFANTPQISETPGEGGLKTVRFAETKPLPSYLVAFGVGPFDTVSAGKVGAAPLRVITPRGRGSEAKFAAAAIPQLLTLLEQYFGVPFPYQKLDSIVMPISNFAMENAGLITYGQSLLLSKPENDSIQRQRQCAIVVAHEMAHQWFGDLVTTAWWNDIWLNEAFATWMENKMVEQWKPEWNVDVTAIEDRLGAMNLDSLVSARQIRQPIQSNNDIANAFDGITYQKGAAVLSMFESWIGPDKFRNGVRLYIRKHANGIATTPDFEAALSEAAGRNIGPAFDSFLDKAGVPVVTVAVKCGSGQPALELTQQRSLPIGSPGSPGKQIWQIPVCVKYSAAGKLQRDCTVMADPRTEMPLRAGATCPDWILLNDNESGYYRANYQGDFLKKLLTNAGSQLSIAERVGILGDVEALVATGDITPSTAFSLVPGLKNDPERHIAATALNLAEHSVGVIVPDDLRPKGEKFIRDNFGERGLALGWTAKAGEDDNTRLLRKELVGPVASLGREKRLIDEAGTLARKWLADRTGLDGEMRGSVLQVAAQFGNRELFDSLHAAAKNEKDPGTRQDLLRAMGSFRDPAISGSATQLLLAGEFDIRQSFWPLLFGPLRYPETRALPFQFLKEHLAELLPKLPGEVGGDFAANLPVVGQPFCDAERRAEVKSFFEEKVKNYTGGPRHLAMTLESIDLCIAMKNKLGPEIADFLRKY